jgi:hypothetical protein
VRSGDVPVNADPGAAQAGEVLLSHVSARAIEAVCLLMLNSLDRETLMQVTHAAASSHARPFPRAAGANE